MTELASKQTVSWRDYYEMCKPRVVMLMILTSMVGMFLAVPGMVPWDILILGNLGIALVAGSGAVVNHLIDYRVDSVMKRTHNRPIPQGRVDQSRRPSSRQPSVSPACSSCCSGSIRCAPG